MAHSSSTQSTLLTADDVRRLKRELDGNKALYASLPATIEAQQRRFDAAMMFVPEDFQLDEDPLIDASQSSEAGTLGSEPEQVEQTAAEDDGRRGTWASEIRVYMASIHNGVSHRELLDALLTQEPRLPQSKGQKGFYNAVARMLSGGELVKAKGRLYSPRVIADMRSRGEALPAAEMRTGTSSEILLRVLREHPEGMTGVDLKVEVAKDPQAPRSVAEHGHYIYNLLAGLIGRGLVTKNDDGLYKLKEPQ